MKLSKCFWNRYNFAWPFWRSHAIAEPADYSCVHCQRAQVSRYPNFTVLLLVSEFLIAKMNAGTIIHGLIMNKDTVTLPALYITSSSTIMCPVAHRW